MYKISPIIVLLLLSCLFISCTKNTDSGSKFYKARVAGYDLNCSVCLLELPEANSALLEKLGESAGNIYKAVNMNKADFEVGQEFKVILRSPKTGETRACITQYPSLDYKEVFVEEKEDFRYITYNDTITLNWHDCVYDPADKFYLTFDSVTNESRCPIGVECFWAGMATVKFRYQDYYSIPRFFNMNAYNDTATVINGLKIKTVSLDPWPKSGSTIKQEDYRVNIIFLKDE